MFELLARIFQLGDVAGHLAHRPFDLSGILVRREAGQAAIGRQFHIDRNAVGIQPGLMHDFRIRFGDGLEMDITAKIMFFAKDARHFDQLLHRVIGAFDDA